MLNSHGFKFVQFPFVLYIEYKMAYANTHTHTPQENLKGKIKENLKNKILKCRSVDMHIKYNFILLIKLESSRKFL